MGRFKTRTDGNILSIIDLVTNQSMYPYAPVFVREDFLGQALDTTNGPFAYRDTGAATEAIVADAANGVLALTLTSANEAQLAGIDQADQLTWVLNQNLVFEARVRASVLPTTGTVVCIGLCDNHNAAVDTVAKSLWFRLDGATGGLITVESDDGTTETTKVSTGVTLTTADWVILRIDCSDPTSVKFFINGEQVAATTTFNANATPTAPLQMVARIGKEAIGTSVGTLQVDYLQAWQNRS
jgi:hypothetical protein